MTDSHSLGVKTELCKRKEGVLPLSGLSPGKVLASLGSIQQAAMAAVAKRVWGKQASRFCFQRVQNRIPGQKLLRILTPPLPVRVWPSAFRFRVCRSGYRPEKGSA